LHHQTSFDRLRTDFGGDGGASGRLGDPARADAAWVLALPKRLRPALRNHAALATRVVRIFIGSIVGRESAQLQRADSAGCAWWNPRLLWFGTFQLISRAGSTELPLLRQRRRVSKDTLRGLRS